MTKAAIYIRVSTDEQAASGLGLAAQEEKARAYAAYRGWDVVGLWEDAGVSGSIAPEDRPAFGGLLAAAAHEGIDKIVCFSVDRLTRRVGHLAVLTDDCAKRGLGLAFVREGIDTTDAMQTAFLHVAGVFAQLERDLIRQRTKDALAARRAAGGWQGRLPYGYAHSEAITVDEDAAATVAYIFAQRATGASYNAIATALNERGTPTPRGGGEWRHNAVRSILNNEALYRGGDVLPAIL